MSRKQDLASEKSKLKSLLCHPDHVTLGKSLYGDCVSVRSVSICRAPALMKALYLFLVGETLKNVKEKIKSLWVSGVFT